MAFDIVAVVLVLFATIGRPIFEVLDDDVLVEKTLNGENDDEDDNNGDKEGGVEVNEEEEGVEVVNAPAFVSYSQ